MQQGLLGKSRLGVLPPAAGVAGILKRLTPAPEPLIKPSAANQSIIKRTGT
jgi:hypothetical protein